MIPEKRTPPPLPTLEQVPEELRNLRQWCCWKAVWDENKKKWRKPPHSPVTGEGIGANEKWESHWLTFEQARAGCQKHGLDGVGFVFRENDPYVGIDIDNSRHDGQNHHVVDSWLKWLPTYAEISPSGTGVHAIGKAKIKKSLTATPLPDADGATVEIYDSGRYFTFTGQRISKDSTIGDFQLGTDKLLQYLGGDGAQAKSRESAPNTDRPLRPSQVRKIYTDALDKLRSAPQGAGNATLNTTALIACRVFKSGVFENTEDQFKQELLAIVTKDWKQPHDEAGARSTIESGWAKGASEGAFKLHQYPTATEALAYCLEAPKKQPYIVEGVIYQGISSQLMGTIKAGKTTWLFTLLRNVLAGKKFMGLPTNPINILYVTEQPKASFQAQLMKSGLDKNNLLEPAKAKLFVIDLGDLWNLDWEARAEAIRENATKLNCGLVIIDTFPRVALVAEMANIGEMNQVSEAIAPVSVSDGKALMLVWHERKAGGSIFEAAAGTAASGGAMDMMLRIQRAQGSKINDRKRQFEIVGRLPTAFEETVVIELNSDMSDYAVIGSRPAAVKKSLEARISGLLPHVPPGVTVKAILDALEESAETEGLKAPDRSSVVRVLDEWLEAGTIAQTGGGKKGDPLRYYYVTSM